MRMCVQSLHLLINLDKFDDEFKLNAVLINVRIIS